MHDMMTNELSLLSILLLTKKKKKKKKKKSTLKGQRYGLWKKRLSIILECYLSEQISDHLKLLNLGPTKKKEIKKE